MCYNLVSPKTKFVRPKTKAESPENDSCLAKKGLIRGADAGVGIGMCWGGRDSLNGKQKTSQTGKK